MRRRDFLAGSLVACAPVQNSRADSVRPDLALWKNIKRALLEEDGGRYFETSFKGAMVPGGANGVLMFKAAAVSATPADNPSTLVVSMVDRNTPEVTLDVKGADRKSAGLKRSVQPDTDVWFQGVPESFSKDPFMVTFSVRPEDVRFEAPRIRPGKRPIPLPRP